MKGEPFFITTPIYYVNDVPHIGHAYTSLACDVLARFMRLDGRDVMFLTGTDEHGQKVEKAAIAAGDDPKSFTDRMSRNFRRLAEALKLSNDQFIRTTEPRHLAASQAIWRKLVEKGEIYLGKYDGWYSVRDEAFYAESELTEGPDGVRRAPSGAEVEWVEEPSYFFRLSAWQAKLLEFYDDHPDFVGPNSRRNEVIGFVKGSLQDLSVSRTTFTWGVKVPDAPGHVMYVWLDALMNYLTALGYPDTNAELYRRYWPAALHMVGKDIVRFHAVYWPAFLMAAGIAPPRRVFAHGWWTNEGQKISKSLGNVIDPFALIDEFGLDPVRYFLLREVPFGGDGDFSRAALIRRINGDLANDLGNLVQRVLSFVQKNAGAEVPKHGAFTAKDAALLNDARKRLYDTLKYEIAATPAHVNAHPAFHRALEAIWAIVGRANSYIDEEAPWALRKTDIARMNTVLYALMETIRAVAILLQPFMPDSAAKILDQLAVPEDARGFAAIAGKMLVPGTKLPAPMGVFPRWQTDAQAAESAAAKPKR